MQSVIKPQMIDPTIPTTQSENPVEGTNVGVEDKILTEISLINDLNQDNLNAKSFNTL